MSFEELRPHVEFVAAAGVHDPARPAEPQGVVAAIGHFGNFELYARFGQFAPAYKCATTYRGLRQPSLNRAAAIPARDVPAACYFERRFDGAALQSVHEPAGRHAGPAGRPARAATPACACPSWATIAPPRRARHLCAALPLRAATPAFAIASAWPAGASKRARKSPPTRTARPGSTAAIMLDVNRAFEAAVRRDPANWFWVHNRGKPPGNPQPALACRAR